MIPVAVIGLGKVAWRFDEEPGRRVTWSHVGAWKTLGAEVSLVGAVDPDPNARVAFAASHHGIATYETIEDLADKAKPRILSICTPGPLHRITFERALDAMPSVSVVWCEKPFATSIEDARAMLSRADERGIRIVVSHVRRWTPIWQRARAIASSGELGSLRSLTIRMPNRLWSIGSHAVDLATMLGGEATSVVGIDVPTLMQDGEPARPCLISFASGAHGAILVTGWKDQLMVEADLIGDKGRIVINENKGTIAHQAFELSERYGGYRELGAAVVETLATLADMSPFECVARECVSLLADPSLLPTASGKDALKNMSILEHLGGLAS